MQLKLEYSCRLMKLGRKIPWWYAPAIWPPYADYVVCYPIGLHWIVRLWHNLTLWWHRAKNEPRRTRLELEEENRKLASMLAEAEDDCGYQFLRNEQLDAMYRRLSVELLPDTPPDWEGARAFIRELDKHGKSK